MSEESIQNGQPRAEAETMSMSAQPREGADDPPTSSASPDVAVAAPRPKTVPDRRVDHLPPWKVLLHNDDVNIMEDVVRTIRELTAMSLERAVKCTLEAHRRGIALLVVTHREKAELLQEQFASKRLTVTIEPDAKP